MKHTALMIIDTQKALFENTLTPLYNEDALLVVLQGLIKDARAYKMPILYIQHTESEGEFKKDTATWAIHEAIKATADDYVIEKRSWDAFYETSLDETLKSLDITHLIVAGMQTAYCLDTTLRCGYSKGYSFTVIEDGHSTMDGYLQSSDIIAHHNRIWHGRFADVVLSQSLKWT